MVEVLREHGHRVTRPRQAVWHALVATADHLTAEELARVVPEADLASIYRALSLFEELGLVRQSRIGPAEAATHWELAHPDEHFHVVCDACGFVDHHVGTLVQSIRTHLAGDHGFMADRVELRVTGRCHRCSG